MHYFIFGDKDSTIYSGGTTSSINTGADEILEINKDKVLNLEINDQGITKDFNSSENF